MISNKDFPALPPPQPKPEQRPQTKKKEERENIKKQEVETKPEIHHEKPVSYKEAEENPFQMKANKSNKNKNKNVDNKNPKIEKDFPVLGSGPITGPSIGSVILTERKDALEKEFGIKINNKKKGKR